MSFASSRSAATAPAGAPEGKLIDYLRVTIQISRVVLHTPSKIAVTCLATPRASSSQYALYTKWERGSRSKGKLTPVLMNPSTSSRPERQSNSKDVYASSSAVCDRAKRPDLAAVTAKQVVVSLPSTYQIEFAVRMRMKAKSGNGSASASNANTTYEKKTLEIELWFLKYKQEDLNKAQEAQSIAAGAVDQKYSDSRTCAGTAIVDLRDLLANNVRTGEAAGLRIDLSREGDYIDATYVVDYDVPGESVPDVSSDCSSVRSWATSSSSAVALTNKRENWETSSAASSTVVDREDSHRKRKWKKNPLNFINSLVKGVDLSKDEMPDGKRGIQSYQRDQSPCLSTQIGDRRDMEAAVEVYADSDDMMSNGLHHSPIGAGPLCEGEGAHTVCVCRQDREDPSLRSEGHHGRKWGEGKYNQQQTNAEGAGEHKNVKREGDGGICLGRGNNANGCPIADGNGMKGNESTCGTGGSLFPFTPSQLIPDSEHSHAAEAWAAACNDLVKEIAEHFGHASTPGREEGEKHAFSSLSTITAECEDCATARRSVAFIPPQNCSDSGGPRGDHSGSGTQQLYHKLLGFPSSTEEGELQGQHRSALLSGSCFFRLHVERGDLAYPQYSHFQPAHPFPHGAYVHNSYRMRLKKDRYLDSEEYAILVAAGDHVVVHSLNVIPGAPVVGDSVRLEIVLHLYQNSVEVFVYPCVTSGRVKFLFGSAVKEQTAKLAEVLRVVVSDMLGHYQNKHRASAQTNRRSLRFSIRNSGLRQARLSIPKALSSSLDPNLWRRLNDHRTLPHESLVIIILRRLQILPPPARVTPPQIQAIENVMGYHRRNQTVVIEALELLLVYSRSARTQQLVSCSATLPTTIRCVIDLHKGVQFGANIEQFLTAVSQAGAAQKVVKKRELAATRNPWYVLSANIGDADVVEPTLLDLTQGRAVVMNDAQVNLLKAAICLHLHTAAICLHVISILEYNQRRNPHMANLKKLDSVFLLAIARAVAAHRSVATKLLESADFAYAVRQREMEQSCFDRLHAGVVKERPLHECAVKLLRARPAAFLLPSSLVRPLASLHKLQDGRTGGPSVSARSEGEPLPRWPTGGEQLMLYVTASWICVGDHVMALSEITSLYCYRWWLMPCLRICCDRDQRSSSSHIYPPLLTSVGGSGVGCLDIMVWERDELLAHLALATGGRISLLQYP